jgi:hypothetical protein
MNLNALIVLSSLVMTVLKEKYASKVEDCDNPAWENTVLLPKPIHFVH